MSRQAVIETTQIEKIYRLGGDERDGGVEIKALDGVSIKIYQGEMVGIVGKSGSGKSTLMHIIGLLDQPTAGNLKIEGTDVSDLSDRQRAELRSKKIGFVFQSFNLLPRASALENVMLPLIYAGIPARQREERARLLLDKVGLANRAGNMPNQLSGGQQQRVAIARALANHPSLILADEPTGNLDTKSGDQIEAVLKQLHQEGNTIVVVTHDATLAKKCQRVIKLRDGKVVS